MRTQLVALTIAALAAAGFAAPSAHADDTSTTFVLEGSGLSISTPTSKELSAGTATGSATLSAQIGAVTVSDGRGALLGSWTASVTSTDFTTGTATADETIAKSQVDYWSGLATATSGTAVFTPGQADALAAQALSASRTAFAATGVVGNNSAAWNPTVVVRIPSDAVAGTYTGTITHSAA